MPGPAEGGEGLNEERQARLEGEQGLAVLPGSEGGLKVGALRHQGRQAQQGLQQAAVVRVEQLD